MRYYDKVETPLTGKTFLSDGEGRYPQTDERVVVWFTEKPEGKVRDFDEEGFPIFVDEPEPPPYVPTDYDLKLQGVEIEGVMCSATKEDMWGLTSALTAISMGVSTNFEFDNGTELLITPENYEAAMAIWMPFRLSFFN